MSSFTEKKMFKNERDRKVVRHGFKTLINNEKLSDIKFVVGIENKIYHGIKALFAMNSTTFNQLLYNNNNNDEKKNEIDNDDNDDFGGLDDDDNDNNNISLDQVISLNHISCKGFEFIQSYFYQNPKKLTIDILVDVLLTSKEFELINIEQECIKALEFLKQTPKYIPYLIQIVNQLYYKGKYQMATNMLISTNYVLVEFIFITLTQQNAVNNNNNNNINNTKFVTKPIFYAVAMEKTQTVNDLKRYTALTFITDSIGKGSKDVIICTAKNNACINIQHENTNIMQIIDQCIVVYYCPTIIIQDIDDDDNKDNKNEEDSKTNITSSAQTELITVKIYNKSENNMELAVSFPFVIRMATFPSFNAKTFKNKIAEIVGVILNDDGLLNIKDGNIPFQMKFGENKQISDSDTINITEFELSDKTNEIILFWTKDTISQIDKIWSDNICESNKSQRLTAPIDCAFLPPHLKNYEWMTYLENPQPKDVPHWEIKDEIKYIRQHLKDEMDNPILSDVKFEIGKQTSAHKTFYGISALFAVQSTVFEAQFFGSMFESQPIDGSHIRLCKIDDISPDTFEFLREYFYNLDPKINNFNAVEIVYASTKYLLPGLQYPCSKFINSLYDTNNDSNILDIYTCLPMMIQLYNIGFHDMSISLLNKSVHLYRNAYNAMKQNGFLDLPLHILKVLINSDEFGANEYDIYCKIIEWTQYQIKKHGEENIKNIINNDKDENDENDEKDENKDAEQEQKVSAIQKLMNEFKYSIRWVLIPLSNYKENQCGQYCLNKNELKLINNLLTNPQQHLMENYEFYNRFKCFYRDYNKHLDDIQCISYKYYESQKTQNDEYHILQFVYIDLDFNNSDRHRSLKSPTFYGCTISKTATIDDFRKYCSKRFDVVDCDSNGFENIFICLVLEGKIFHVFNVKDKIIDLNTNRYLICVYYSPLIDIRSIKVEMDESDDDEFVEQKEKYDIYPYSESIDGWNYRWNYNDDIQKKQNETTKPKKKRQHLLSIVHINSEHKENLKPLCGIPLLLNLYCESKINLFTLQKHYLSNIAKIIMDDQLYESITNSDVHSIKFIDENIKRYFDIVVRRNFIYYGALDPESVIKLEKSDTQNLLCLKFEQDQIHNFKKSFTHSIKYCRKHISAPPTSMEWKLIDDYTEKKMIRVFRGKDKMKLKSKPKI